jgi:hypothetical protein
MPGKRTRNQGKKKAAEKKEVVEETEEAEEDVPTTARGKRAAELAKRAEGKREKEEDTDDDDDDDEDDDDEEEESDAVKRKKAEETKETEVFLTDLERNSRAARLVMNVSARGFPKLEEVTIKYLLNNWDSYKDGLVSNIVKLRNDKLVLYATQSLEAKKSVDLSQSRISTWRNVFEQRYSMSGDPEQSAGTFIDEGVNKLVPDDMTNITAYMRFRSLFLILYNDAVKRQESEGDDSILNNEKLKKLIAPLIESEDTDSRSGGGKKFGRCGGGRKKKRAKPKGDAEEELARCKEESKRWPDSCLGVSEVKDPLKYISCQRQELAAYHKRYVEIDKENDDLLIKYEGLIDRREALEGAQPWLTADWPNLPKLLKAEKAVKKLHSTLTKISAELVGRDEIFNLLASMIVTFSQNHRAFTQTYLNFALLGMPGTGKTTIAQAIASILRYMGILLTDKFSIVGREDLCGQYLGETAIKTKTLLINHIEGVIFLDEAYSLGTRDSEGKPDVYGAESLNTITNQTDKFRGQFSFIAAGYEKNMNEDFFGVNPGLERRFRKLMLRAFSPRQLVDIYLKKLKKKIVDPKERAMLLNKETWQYIFDTFTILNKKCENAKTKVVGCFFPSQAGDIELLADDTVQYFYNYVNVKNRTNKSFTACDVQYILRQFFLRTQRADVLLHNGQLDRECPPTACEDGNCAVVSNPNRQLIAAFRRTKTGTKLLKQQPALTKQPMPIPYAMRYRRRALPTILPKPMRLQAMVPPPMPPPAAKPKTKASAPPRRSSRSSRNSRPSRGPPPPRRGGYQMLPFPLYYRPRFYGVY